MVFSIWHVPVLYNLMMRDHNFHIVMHLMVMGDRRADVVADRWAAPRCARPLAPPAQMLYLFLLGTPMMAVAALITFARRSRSTSGTRSRRASWASSALEDQRLGGLIMWVPGGLFYWAVMSVVFFRWSARESRPRASQPRSARLTA